MRLDPVTVPPAPLHPRAAELIARLALAPHPEGGHYAEIFRSAALVAPADGRGARGAITTIFFLLAAGERSRWHRVRSDEVWHHYEGAPLELLVLDPEGAAHERVLLGPVGDATHPVHTVPAGYWQAARSTGDYTLVGCSVGPGFDFADFAMLSDLPGAAERVLHGHPELRELL